MKKSRKGLMKILLIGAIAVSAAVWGGNVCAATPPAQNQKFIGDFFIISSINQGKSNLFLKAPTEVTEEMLVDKNTAFFNAQGQHIELKDLRAGDTVYVVARQQAKGLPIAVRIQQGPMTLAILHSRYLTFQ